MHVLSNYGLALPEFEGEDGVIYRASPGQLRLLKYWKHLCKTVNESPKWQVKEVWVVGDALAGLNPAERGRRRRGTLDEQVRVAVELLDMMPKKATIKVWSGSEYHESIETMLHERIVEQLKLRGRKALFRGAWSFEKVGDTTAFVCHHSSTAIVYPETPMIRDSRWFKIQYFDGKLPKVHWIIRAHKHISKFVDDRGIYIIQLPAWQTIAPWSRILKQFPMWIPDIGAAFIWTEQGRRRYQEWLYPPFLIDEKGRVIEVPYDKKRYVEIE